MHFQNLSAIFLRMRASIASSYISLAIFDGMERCAAASQCTCERKRGCYYKYGYRYVPGRVKTSVVRCPCSACPCSPSILVTLHSNTGPVLEITGFRIRARTSSTYGRPSRPYVLRVFPVDAPSTVEITS